MASLLARVHVFFLLLILSFSPVQGMNEPRFSGMRVLLVASSPKRHDSEYCRQQLGLGVLPDPTDFEGELRIRCERARAIQGELFEQFTQDEPDTARALDFWQEAAYREARFADERNATNTRVENAVLGQPLLSPQMLMRSGAIARPGMAGPLGATLVFYPPIALQMEATCGWNAVDYLPALELFFCSREGDAFLQRIAKMQGDNVAMLEENMLLGVALSRLVRRAEDTGCDAFYSMIEAAGGFRDQMDTDRPVGVRLNMLYSAIANWAEKGLVSGPILELRQRMHRTANEPLFCIGFRMGCNRWKNIMQLCMAMRDGHLPLLRFLTVVNMGDVPHVFICALVKSPYMARPIIILVNSNHVPVIGSSHWARANENYKEQLYTPESSRMDYVVGLMHCLAASIEISATCNCEHSRCPLSASGDKSRWRRRGFMVSLSGLMGQRCRLAQSALYARCRTASGSS